MSLYGQNSIYQRVESGHVYTEKTLRDKWWVRLEHISEAQNLWIYFFEDFLAGSITDFKLAFSKIFFPRSAEALNLPFSKYGLGTGSRDLRYSSIRYIWLKSGICSLEKEENLD